jgi:bifunctional UDP-N-acetylglucosamine pyrophosphorylase / glucosamine-1-phosphate N-acetyltransferase
MIQRPVVLILAGRERSRVKSGTPAPLVPVLGTTAAGLVLAAARSIDPERIFFASAGAGGDIDRFFENEGAVVVGRDEASDAASAVVSAGRRLGKRGADRDILVLQASLLLIRESSVRSLLARHRRTGNPVTVLRAPGTDAEVSGAGAASPAAVFRLGDLLKALAGSVEKRGALRTTGDLACFMAARGAIGSSPAGRLEDLFEAGDRFDISIAASMLRLRKIRDLARAGVTVLDPSSTWIDLDVRIGKDTIISPSVIIEGDSRIGRGCRLFPNVRIAGSRIGNGVTVFDSTIIEDCVLDGGVQAGPFSRLRPGTRLRAGARVGNFVEMKKTDFGRGSKALHLTYLGDSKVGEGVNVGAGTITCNYDGVRKNKTVIGDGAFIGSGTELVAPVRIGRKAYVGAGSAITRDVSPGALAIARGRQVEKPGWVEKQNRKKAAGAAKPRRRS